MAGGGKNAYLAKREEARIARETQVLAWGVQLVFDGLTLVLNDPEYMGKDVFGQKRLDKLNKALNEVTREIMQGLMVKTNPGASYTRAVVDTRLQKIAKDSFAPWPERYLDWDDRGI